MARNEPLQQSTSPIGILHELTPLPPGQNGHHFEYDIFKCIFLIENKWNSLKISLKSVPKGPINNIPALVQIKAWHQPMVVKLLTHLCGTRPQWINALSSLNKMANVVCRQHLQMHFLESKFLYFGTNITKTCFQGSNLYCNYMHALTSIAGHWIQSMGE